MLDLTKLEDYQLGDVETLAKLFSAQDTRTIDQMVADETDYQDCHVEAVKPAGDGYEIRWDDGWCTVVKGAEPKVGDTVRTYGAFGHPRYGWALNGKVIEFETPWERFVSRLEMLAGFDRRKREHYVEAKDDMARWYDELSGPYKARIDRFRAERPDFDVECGSYEMYPVLMAQRIDAWCEETGYTVEEFRDREYSDQAKVIHAGQPDNYGISGHQFDSACGLAKAVREGVTV